MGYKFWNYARDDGSGNPTFYNRDGTELLTIKKVTNGTEISGEAFMSFPPAFETGRKPKALKNMGGPTLRQDGSEPRMLRSSSGGEHLRRAALVQADLSLLGRSIP